MQQRFQNVSCLIISFCVISLFSIISHTATAQMEPDMLNERIIKETKKIEQEHQELYHYLHQNPELSGMEIETSGKMSSCLSRIGFDVTTEIGGHGVVGVYKNGEGPVIMLRTDMDALPIKEATGLSYASKKVMENGKGEICPVMHACGHDMHMAVWLGTLTTLVNLHDKWNGTLLALAQPAEELDEGSFNMIEDGLFTRFPVPDLVLCYHVSPEIPAGQIGYLPGFIKAGAGSADITIYGFGGHGAKPDQTIDPIVLASRTVLGIQTIVSRNINPIDPAVITVGSIHGGTKNNIIPDKVKLQLTIRFFKEDIYQQIKESLKTLTTGIALSAGLPENKMPDIIFPEKVTPSVYNDPELVGQSVKMMQSVLGEENLIMVEPSMGSEDFARYGLTKENIPIALFLLGSTDKNKYEEYKKNGRLLPSLHNPEFCPDFKPSFQAGVCAMSKAIIDLMNSHH